PAAGVELGVGLEQHVLARLAPVDTLGLGVGVLTHEGALGAGLAQDGVLLRRELLTPLLVGLLHLVAHASTVIGASTAQRTQTRCGPSAVKPAASNASSSAPCS